MLFVFLVCCHHTDVFVGWPFSIFPSFIVYRFPPQVAVASAAKLNATRSKKCADDVANADVRMKRAQATLTARQEAWFILRYLGVCVHLA